MKLLIKLGGSLLDSPETQARLAGEIRKILRSGAQIVVVHGGGKQMNRFLSERGVESRFIDGLRVTTPEVLDAVLKVLAGSVNSLLVAALIEAGVNAVGLSGIDGLLMEAEQVRPELGFVGKPVRANGALLDLLVSRDFLPVVACVAGDRSGNIYNINADQMAAACATAFRAEKLLFLTDVDGVRNGQGKIAPLLVRDECRAFIAGGIATGGMQAKLEAAISALENGVPEVVIAPGAVPEILAGLVSGEPIGTRLVLEEQRVSSNG